MYIYVYLCKAAWHRLSRSVTEAAAASDVRVYSYSFLRQAHSVHTVELIPGGIPSPVSHCNQSILLHA